MAEIAPYRGAILASGRIYPIAIQRNWQSKRVHAVNINDCRGRMQLLVSCNLLMLYFSDN